jgi:predicted DCC family thiol-disulfide oxidoreductase YuxK
MANVVLPLSIKPPLPTGAKPEAALAVYFDGGCPLCRAEIGVYKNCLGADQIDFIDVTGATRGSVLTPGLDKAAALARFHVRTSDGRLHSGAAGFTQLWLTLPRWRWLGRMTGLPGVRILAEIAYRAFLVIRPAIQWIWRAAAGAKTHG